MPYISIVLRSKQNRVDYKENIQPLTLNTYALHPLLHITFHSLTDPFKYSRIHTRKYENLRRNIPAFNLYSAENTVDKNEDKTRTQIIILEFMIIVRSPVYARVQIPSLSTLKTSEYHSRFNVHLLVRMHL